MTAEKSHHLMTVGQLSKRTGASVRTIQYYDQKGLLIPSVKGQKNLRLYSLEDQERLYRIMTLKKLGYSLAQIKESEGCDSFEELLGALNKRSSELRKETREISQSIETIEQVKENLIDKKYVCWSDWYDELS